MCKKIIVFLSGLIFVFILAFILFSDKLLTSYAKSFTVNTASKGADIIFILGGNPKIRPAKAVELLKDGYSNSIYMTFIKDKALKYQEFFVIA